MIPVTHFELARKPGEDEAAKSKEYVRKHWKYHVSDKEPARYDSPSNMDDFLERIQSYSLCISGMAFQDAWNIDLDRLQRCCIHVIAADGKRIPFCAYYLTDVKGRRFTDYIREHLLK